MSKHTPGPWRLSSNDYWKTNPYSVVTQGKAGVHQTTIANTPNRATISPLEREANARLISAAPEMLEVLQTLPGVTATDEELMAWNDKARAAVLKATGESK